MAQFIQMVYLGDRDIQPWAGESRLNLGPGESLCKQCGAVFTGAHECPPPTVSIEIVDASNANGEPPCRRPGQN